jgi:enterochelin esterase family protein
MKKRTIVFLNLLVIFLLSVSLNVVEAQETVKDSIQLNPDGSVTFVYRDTAAKTVKVRCDCKLRREKSLVKKENYHAIKMSRDGAGQWTYTTPPLAPEVYTYQFERDGYRLPDPTNPDSVRVRTEKMSVFIIAGTPQTNLYIVESLRGKLDTVVFQSPNEKKPRRILVYTPPQYREGQDEFPVLYLLHGLNGNEMAWLDRGHAVQSLDNLIAMRKAKPMILVMPDANPEEVIGTKENLTLMKNIFLYPTWNRMDFERNFPAMDDFLSGLYRFAPRLGGRAVAGLSAGAKQSCNMANLYDSTFVAVGLFSPVVSRKQIPKSNFAHYWIGGGVGDLFHYRINGFRKKLQRRHIPYTMYNTIGGHTWRNWRVYFTEYVQTIFWN